MGAVEFEYKSVYINGKSELKNPLFLSLKRIIKGRDNYQWIKMLKRKDAFGNQLYIFCKNEDIEEAKNGVREIIKGKATKRSCGLCGYMLMSKERAEERKNNCRNFWWDIENDIFIVFGDDKVSLINEALDKNYEKWKDELFPVHKFSLFETLKSIFSKNKVTMT